MNTQMKYEIYKIQLLNFIENAEINKSPDIFIIDDDNV